MQLDWKVLAIAGGALLIGAAWWNSAPEGASKGNAGFLRPDDPVIVARGERLYAEYCASCHGANLEGQPGWRAGPGKAPPHDASGHTWHHPDAQLFQITREGTIGRMPNGAMPGFAGKLTDDDIVAVLSYIKSRWPERIRSVHDRINRRAARRSG